MIPDKTQHEQTVEPHVMNLYDNLF